MTHKNLVIGGQRTVDDSKLSNVTSLSLGNNSKESINAFFVRYPDPKKFVQVKKFTFVSGTHSQNSTDFVNAIVASPQWTAFFLKLYANNQFEYKTRVKNIRIFTNRFFNRVFIYLANQIKDDDLYKIVGSSLGQMSANENNDQYISDQSALINWLNINLVTVYIPNVIQQSIKAPDLDLARCLSEMNGQSMDAARSSLFSRSEKILLDMANKGELECFSISNSSTSVASSSTLPLKRNSQGLNDGSTSNGDGLPSKKICLSKNRYGFYSEAQSGSISSLPSSSASSSNNDPNLGRIQNPSGTMFLPNSDSYPPTQFSDNLPKFGTRLPPLSS